MRRLLGLGLVALCFAPASGLAAEALSPEQARTRWRNRLDGKHFVASVHLQYQIRDDAEKRSISVWRDDPEGGERMMARFEEPARLRDFAILFLEQRGKMNDYFVYQPELRRVRRIPERTASEDIYGVDLEVLAFGVAQGVATRVDSLETVELDGKPVLRLVERALEGNQRFDERIAHLDPTSYLPLRVEHRREGATVLIAITEEVATIQGVATPMRSRFVRPLDSSEVLMIVESVDYEQPIPGAFFSTIGLVRR